MAKAALNLSIFAIFGLAAWLAFDHVLKLRNETVALKALQVDFGARSRRLADPYDVPAIVFKEPVLLGEGYRMITEERPLRDGAGNVVLGQRGKAKGQPQADSSLRDTENVPLSEDVQSYFEREVLPHVPDAWIDHDKTKLGYEIPFNRHFYVFTLPRPLEVIDAELKQVTDRILEMIGGLSG
jgi:hypothetical protein